MLRNDELLERICVLERANRFWKGLALGLAAALALFLVLGAFVGFSLYFQTRNQQLEIEAAMQEARQQENIARQQAEKAAEEARKAALEEERAREEKRKAQP
jgi:hypothetical protein